MDLVRGGEVHAHVVRFGFEMDVDVVNALIAMYMKCADIVSARTLFDKMPNRDRISWNAMISGTAYGGDVSVYNSLIQMYVGTGHWKEAETVCSRMECRDIVAWTTMISGKLDVGMKFHELAERSGLILYAVVANSLIDMYSKCKRIDKALVVFHQIPDKDVILDFSNQWASD
ncbi:hypothetical protein OIU79_008053 [Salix purpurea]|uniref:Pentatricopeptide repeat-containing protein n=1 Tax=Salix purpurea TaxID=77065 RepID=A0A9Q0THN9_SALPP|nr:hypothetical protein OIU79_008053 [Salix purpurea]